MYGLTGSLIARLLPGAVLYYIDVQQLGKSSDGDTWVCFMLCFWRVKTGLGRDLFLVVYTLIAKTKLVHTPINLIPWPLSSFWSLAILDCILLSSSDFTKLRKGHQCGRPLLWAAQNDQGTVAVVASFEQQCTMQVIQCVLCLKKSP